MKTGIYVSVCLMQTLMDSETVQKLMSLVLAFGNYMNSGIYITVVCLQRIVVLIVLQLSDTFLSNMPLKITSNHSFRYVTSFLWNKILLASV